MALLLSKQDVERSVTMDEVVSAVEHVFGEYAKGDTVMPSKIYLDVAGYGDFRAMPSYIPDVKTAGIKWVNVHPQNPQHGLPTVMATILLSDPETGKLLSVMDGTFITDMRTGAAGGVAAKWLAKKDASTIGLIGSGEQAWTQMLAYKSVYGDRIKLVNIYSRTFAHSVKLAERIEKTLGYKAKAYEKGEEAADADIVATTTPARSPVVKKEWIQPGTHINAIGADAPGKQELETALTVRSKVFVDSYEQASHSGEINVPMSEGALKMEMLAGSLGEVIVGKRPGRTSDKDVTIFDSTGLSIQDMAVANIVYERAIMKKIGKEFSF